MLSLHLFHLQSEKLYLPCGSKVTAVVGVAKPLWLVRRDGGG